MAGMFDSAFGGSGFMGTQTQDQGMGSGKVRGWPGRLRRAEQLLIWGAGRPGCPPSGPGSSQAG